MKQKTLAIIKPDAVEKSAIGEIIRRIEEAGFKILAMKYTRLTKSQAMAFYEVHKEKPFYNDLVKYMTSGPIVPIALEKENAVEDFRKLIGSTDPTKAEEGTIRKLFGTNIERNAIHGSDSAENGEREVLFFFSKSELVTTSETF
ncbi:MAG: Nucleoside diphosphate kinase [Candidatus Kapaibacterium sp.]|jgi:nucleoside-diphosphate kinase|nr:MAG: Nucleoside diphosphate kinase [Candidatus Kapabacteria bacterium]ROL56364.1 MAG: nucleoside-diphosphate kinase [Bacteroidetes/Chlorobi group bacterium Naka2016]